MQQVPIPQFTRYLAQEDGRIYSTFISRVLAPRLNQKGYATARLAPDCGGPLVSWAVHRAIAAAFLGPGPAGHDVDHINRDRLDNRPLNLRYLSTTVNRRQGVRILTDEQVVEIKARLQQGGRELLAPLAAEYKVSFSTLAHIYYERIWKEIA